MKVITLLLILAVLVSCNRVYYAPNNHNIPLFQEKGEARFTAGAVVGDFFPIVSSNGNYTRGLDFQGAYALTNHIGITSAGHYAEAGNDSGGHGRFIEIGAGTFHSFSNRLIGELYCGVGRGNIFNNFYQGRYLQNSFTKLYLQPILGYTYKYFDLGLSIRFARVLMDNIGRKQITTSSTSPNFSYKLETDFENLNNNKLSNFFEYGAVIRFGSESIKFQINYSFSQFIGASTEKYPVTSLNTGLGIIVALNKKERAAYQPRFKF